MDHFELGPNFHVLVYSLKWILSPQIDSARVVVLARTQCVLETLHPPLNCFASLCRFFSSRCFPSPESSRKVSTVCDWEQKEPNLQHLIKPPITKENWTVMRMYAANYSTTRMLMTFGTLRLSTVFFVFIEDSNKEQKLILPILSS